MRVVVAVIEDSNQCVLVSRRASHQHQGGLWEFPGGKIERDESRIAALQREIEEELGLRISKARPLIRVQHDYSDVKVELDVWKVETYRGSAQGREGQAIRWCEPSDLITLKMPAADIPIVNAVNLPDCYAIIGSQCTNFEDVWAQCQLSISKQVGMLMLRLRPNLAVDLEQLELLYNYCSTHRVKLIQHQSSKLDGFICDGYHLSSSELMRINDRKQYGTGYVGASCHDADQLSKAESLQLDYVSLSPVNQTDSHPGKQTLGIHGFKSLCAQINIPVYALGGMSMDDRRAVFAAGGQGVAGISQFT